MHESQHLAGCQSTLTSTHRWVNVRGKESRRDDHSVVGWTEERSEFSVLGWEWRRGGNGLVLWERWYFAFKARVEQLSRNVFSCWMNRRKGEEIGFESKVEALRGKKNTWRKWMMIWPGSFLYGESSEMLSNSERSMRIRTKKTVSLDERILLSLKVKLQWTSREESQNSCALKWNHQRRENGLQKKFSSLKRRRLGKLGKGGR